MSSSDCSVRVAVRCRPLSSKERAERAKSCLRSPQEGQIVIGRSHAFTYDHVFEEGIDQEGVYESCVKGLVDKFMQGFNATILAYGQTGSGKTYTMGTASSHNVAYDSLGIVPRVVETVFAKIQEKMGEGKDEGKNASTTYQVKVQFLEIYNDSINDLLNPNLATSDLSIRETKQGGISVLGATEAIAQTPEDMLNSLDRGTAQRVTGATAMNATSSRSHAIFTMILKQTTQVEIDDKADVREDTIVSKFHFVDLAGSERLKRTGAVGDRMKEGININKGLLALGNVISALGDEKRKGSHVPFRDSKITRLLQDSLGGNSQTLMIACVSPSDTNFDETLNTLKYANRARNIKNKPVINRDPMAAKIEKMSKRIKELETALVASGGGDFLAAGISSEAYEEVTNQLLDSEFEVKRLTKRLETTRGQLSAMRDKVLEAETEQDKMRRKIQKIKTRIKKAQEEGGGSANAGGERKSKLLASLVEAAADSDDDDDDDQDADKDLVAKLRRRVLDLETMLSADSSAASRPRKEAFKSRRVSLGEFSHAAIDNDDDDDDDDDGDVEVSTSYGTGNLVEIRDDGMIVLEMAFGMMYVRDIVTTPFGTGPVVARLSEPDPTARTPMGGDPSVGGGGDGKGDKQDEDDKDSSSNFLVVLLNEVRNNIPAEVCASHILPDDDDDDDDNNTSRGNASASEIEKSKLRLERLAGLTSEVKNLDQDIQKKELLMKKLIHTQQRARIIEKDFKVKINSLEDEVKRIKDERDRALKEIDQTGGRGNAANNRIISKYEAKLKKLGDDLTRLRKKYQENQKALRSKAKAAEKLKRLQGEISGHKKQRVVLQRKMKEASESHRNWIKSTRRELQKAVRERNKAKLKVTKLQSKLNKQALIIKRREDEKEVLKRRLKMFETKARAGRKGRKRGSKMLERKRRSNKNGTKASTRSGKGASGRKNPLRRKSSSMSSRDLAEPSPIVTKFCTGLEYELGEAVAKSDLTQRLNEKLIKIRETKKQRQANKRRLTALEIGTAEYVEALEAADTLKARQALIENQIVQIRTDLATWNTKEHPGNLTAQLFKRHPSMGLPDMQDVVLQLLSKIVRQEMRSKAQDRALDQMEAKLSEASSELSATTAAAKNVVATTMRRRNKRQMQQQQQQQQRTQHRRPPSTTTTGKQSGRRGGSGRQPLSNNWVSAQTQGSSGVHGSSSTGGSGSHHVSSSSSTGNNTTTTTGSSSHHGTGGGSKSKYPSVFDRLTDQATFTGVYKTRAKDRASKRRDKVRSGYGGGSGYHFSTGVGGGSANLSSASSSQPTLSTATTSHSSSGNGHHSSSNDKGGSSSQSSSSVFDRLTDTSNFTGMYKTRFAGKHHTGSGGSGHNNDGSSNDSHHHSSHPTPHSHTDSNGHHPARSRSRSRSVAEEKSGSSSSNANGHSSSKDVFSRLTDKSSYTGMYRHREKILQSQMSPRGESHNHATSSSSSSSSRHQRRESKTSLDAGSSGAAAASSGSSSINGSRGGNATNNGSSSTTSSSNHLDYRGGTGPSFSSLSDQFNSLADEFNTVVYKGDSNTSSSSKHPTSTKHTGNFKPRRTKGTTEAKKESEGGKGSSVSRMRLLRQTIKKFNPA